MPRAYNPKDHYFRKAKEQGYRARSAFKLEEIQIKFKVLKKEHKVLDIGAAPGSFLQYISTIIGPAGRAIGLDLQEIRDLKLPNVRTRVCDITKEDEVNLSLEEIGIKMFDIIVSDIAPATTGIKDVDQARSVELSYEVLHIAENHLKDHGSIVLKVFQGEDFAPFIKKVKQMFSKVSCYKPKATRDRSRETYVVGLDFLKHDILDTSND